MTHTPGVGVARSLRGWARHRLDGPTGRPFLAAATSVVLARRFGRRCRVRFRDGLWEYEWPEGTIIQQELVTDVTATPEGWATRQNYDFDDIFFWGYRPGPDDVVVDVGAGFGSEAFTFSRLVGPGGRVYCFEAHPKTYALLARLRDVNGWENVETVQRAVTSEPGMVTISDDDEYVVNSIVTGGDIEVPAITLDDFVVEHGMERIAFLKMNIEGAERLAIQGMTKTASITDHMTISCHDFLYERDPTSANEHTRTRDEVRGWLQEQGFEVRDRPDDPRDWVRYHLYASRRVAGSTEAAIER